MVRHILDQPPISDTDGPVALILAPTRELAIQIHNEVRRFCKPVGLRSVCWLVCINENFYNRIKFCDLVMVVLLFLNKSLFLNVVLKL